MSESVPLCLPAKAQGVRGMAASKNGEGANLSNIDRRDLAKSGPSEALRIAKSSGWKKTLKVRKVGDKSVDGKKGRVDGKKW